MGESAVAGRKRHRREQKVAWWHGVMRQWGCWTLITPLMQALAVPVSVKVL